MAPLMTYEDYFGNRVHAFSINAPHQELVVKSRSTVVTHTPDPNRLFYFPLEEQLKRLNSSYYKERYVEYLLFTAYTENAPEVKEFEHAYPFNDDGLYVWTRTICSAIYNTLTYDPSATHVHTKVGETLILKRGVCQDYAHLMIAICRSMGLAARYVSGYHFVGDLQGGNADFEQASHAWVEVNIPGTGWLGFDPTNNVEVDWRYVKLGHGRDYKDIVPFKGVYYGPGAQKMDVTVDVQLIDE
jgi:transglutaminase-like putative cysteine protease